MASTDEISSLAAAVVDPAAGGTPACLSGRQCRRPIGDVLLDRDMSGGVRGIFPALAESKLQLPA